MKKFDIIGNPIKHSKLPIIHKYFAEKASIAFQIWNKFKPDSAMVLNKIRPCSLF